MNPSLLVQFYPIVVDGKVTFEVFLFPHQFKPACFLCQGEILDDAPTIIAASKNQQNALGIDKKIVLFCTEDHAKTFARMTGYPSLICTLSPQEPDASEPSSTISPSPENTQTP